MQKLLIFIKLWMKEKDLHNFSTNHVLFTIQRGRTTKINRSTPSAQLKLLITNTIRFLFGQ